MSSPVRVRIAPSPSGHLHVGTARTAVYNWLFARHHKGTFILRIEDTDSERSFPEYIESIQTSLKWLGIDWDEGPYFQSKRLDLYREGTDKFKQSEFAYRCYCTTEELAAARERAMQEKRPPRYDGACRNLTADQRRAKEAEGRRAAWRLRIPEGDIVYKDLVYGELTRTHNDIDDFVCVRADGWPLYNFACVIDDHDMKISHVIRGNDHLTNTFKQILIYRAMGWEIPQFAHLPLNLGKDRKKISKREGATSVIEYKEMGFLPEAIVNFLALLGWSPGNEREIMTRDEMIELFSLERVNPANPVFDIQKLEWMNGEYIRSLSPSELADRVAPVLIKAGLLDEPQLKSNRAWIEKAIGSLQERVRLLNDVVDLGAYYFTDKFEYDPKGAKKHFSRPGVDGDLSTLADEFAKIPTTKFTLERTETVLRELAEKLGRQPAELIHPLRLSLTGLTLGPGLFEIVMLLGRDKCVSRIKRAVEFIRAGVPV
jgi:glutamyl-tRNA synthetase